MTVALLGVGADSTNASPTPPVHSDGTFEWIPIPESEGPTGTTESATYGTTPLRHGDGTLADYLDSISPRWGDDDSLSGDALAAWPLHRDPNFAALTYGETASRGAYVALLRGLDPGDLVAFYTGLQADPGGPRHRYVVGYFTVNSVLDCRAVAHDGEQVRFSDLPGGARADLLDAHADNAHVKRVEATGRFAAPDDGVVIVDGREPGGLLDRAFPISRRSDSGHYYLREDLATAWSPESGGDPDRTAYLGGIKVAHRLDVAPEEFREVLGEWHTDP